MATLKEALDEPTDELSQSQAQAATLAEERDQLRSQITALQETVATQQAEGGAQQQRISDLEDQVQDKQAQVASMEDKHQHARDALEHYRASVREQQDLDQRRHEQQLQQLQQVQAGQRQLRETLAIKQEELTGASQEVTRLFAALTEVRKQLEQCDHRDTSDERAQLTQEVNTLRKETMATQKQEAQITQLRHQMQALEAELNAKNTLPSQWTRNLNGEKESND